MEKLYSKIKILLLLLLLSSTWLNAQTPGGVSSGLQQWLKADTGTGQISYYNVPAGNRSSNGSWASPLIPSNSVLNSGNSWSVDNNATAGRYLQLDLGAVQTIEGIVTQGRADADQWVTTYTVEYSSDNVTYTPYGITMNGNFDRNTLIANMFNTAISARYIKIIPQTYYGHKSMRVDLISTTTAATDNTPMGFWQDQSPISADAAVAADAYRPTLKLNSQNFNPAFEFDGTNDFFASAPGFSNFTTGTTVFSATAFNTTAGVWQRMIDYGNGNDSNNLIFSRSGATENIRLETYIGATGYASDPTNALNLTNEMRVYDFVIPAGTANSIKTPTYNVNAQSFASPANIRVLNNINRYKNFIGKSNWAADSYFKGRIPELIIYNRDLTATERQKVQSYLAIKYGLTMGGTAADKNYILADGTVVWDATANLTYKNNPAGIGRDNASGLMQKQSQNATANFKLTVGLSTIETTNALNAATFTADKDFLMWGDNAGDQSFGFSVTQGKPGILTGGYYRMGRVWKMQETGTVGTVRIAAPTTSDAYLIVSSSAAFTAGNTWYPLTAITINGVQNYYADVDVTNGQFITFAAPGTAPGGVADGTFRGWKAEMFEGSFSDNTKFGSDTSNTTPSVWGYTGTVVGREMVTQVGDYYGMEYNGTLEVPQTGVYSFVLTGVDDNAYLWVNNQYLGSRTCCGNSATFSITLTAGDVPIRIKFIEFAGVEGMGITWSGPGITANSVLDGRYVKTDASLSHWFSADNTSKIVSGANTYINTWNNQAPAFKNVGNMYLNAGSAWTKVGADDRLINYNTAGQFDGNDQYLSKNAPKTRSSNGLVYQNGPFQAYNMSSYFGNITGTHWIWGYGYDCSNNNVYGFWKNSSTEFGLARVSTHIGALSSPYVLNEPKIEEGYYNLGIGNAASTLNFEAARANGAASFNSRQIFKNSIFANVNGIHFGAICNYTSSVYLPEFIYYPFKLTDAQAQKVNTYLAVKYGVTLTAGDYVATDDTVIWNRTANATFSNRIFGIGRELATEGLNQKQSQSRMKPSSNLSSEFLKIAKGALATSNTANTSELKDKDYLLVGDDNGAMATQTNEIPSTIDDGSCNFSRLTREWKAAVTGTPGAITVVAGSADAGSFKFTNSMKGIKLMVDEDGDADFSTGTIRSYDFRTFVNGVATFSNVILNDGEIFSFAWKQTAPGGVASGLIVWLDISKESTYTDNTDITTWNDLSPNGYTGTGYNNVKYRSGGSTLALNYNPTVYFDGSNDYIGLSAFNKSFTAGFTHFSVAQINNSNNWQRIFDFGNGSDSNNLIFAKAGAGFEYNFSMYNGTIGGGSVSTSGTQLVNNQPALLAVTIAAGTAGTQQATNIYKNGVSAGSGTVAVPQAVNRTANYIARSNWPDPYLNGLIPEEVFYNRILTATERTKVSSYLAIKYSQPLGNGLGTSVSDYIASDATPIWTGNATYKNYMFGIGRDDCSGLDQRQSISFKNGDKTNVKIGLGTINETGGNENNTNAFSTDKQFIVMGALKGDTDTADLLFTGNSDTQIPSAFTDLGSCNAKRWNQTWKVQNTNAAGNVQIKVGANYYGLKITKGMAKLRLVVDEDGDGDFSNAAALYAATSVTLGVATFDNVALPDGATWTLVWDEAAPGGVIKPTEGTDIAGQIHVNGLAYTLYSCSADTNMGDGITGTILSTGYLNNTDNFDDIFLSKISDNFAVELKGKIYLTTGVNYKFRYNGLDDHGSLHIDGTLLLNVTLSSTASATFTVPSTGYYDMIARGREAVGGETFNLEYSINNGSTFGAIPDNLFFVQPKGPSAWFASDDGSFDGVADGAAITGAYPWYDLSVNGNNLTMTQGNPIYYHSNASKLRNYNQVIRFDDERFTNTGYLSGFPYSKMGKTMFALNTHTNHASTDVMFSWGKQDTSQMQGYYRTNSNLFVWGNGDDVDAGALYTATDLPYIVNSTYKNSSITATNNIKAYNNTKLLTTTTKTTWKTFLAPSVQLTIGNGYGMADANGWNGDITETIVYPWAISDTERQKVNSYLALKWGQTLDQTTPTDYLSSDGTVIWDKTIGASYKTDITGLGRDDCGALYQLQSTSTDGNDIVSMGRGSIAVSNSLNTNTISADKSYLVIGHNNLAVNTLNTTNMPTALTSEIICYQKMDRVWQVQAVGNTGTLTMNMGKAGLFSFSKSYYKPKLLISNSPTDWSAAQVVDYSSITSGIATFNNVTLENGQYFTMAIINAAPGGVNTNLNLWLTADEGTSTTTDNTALTSWADTGLLGMNGTAVGSPLYRSGASAVAANFNPVVGFNGTSQYFNLPTGFSDFTAGASAFAVLNTNFGTVGNFARIFHFSSAANNNHGFTWGRHSTTTNVFSETFTAASASTGFSSTDSALATTNGYALHSMSVGAGTSGQTGREGKFYFNGFNSTTVTTAQTPFTISRTNNRIGNSPVSNFINGYLPEIAIYNRLVTPTEQAKINSYFAVKYGKTLNVSVADYVNSAGASIYSYTDYWNRITGIGRDDCAALDQRQSKSVETSALITVSYGSALATENSTHTEPFDAHNTWMLFGDNNKSILWTGVDMPTSQNIRINRVWRVKETGTVNTVFLQVPDNSSALSVKLPTEGTKLYLMVANAATNGKFSEVSGVREEEMTLNGTNWEIMYDFADGDYFTFSTDKTCVGPAGITEGLTSWYKTNELTTGAIAPTSGTLTDVAYGNYNLTRNASGTATVTAGSATGFNYNRYLALSGNAVLQKTALSENSVVSADSGAMFAVSSGSNYTFSLSRSGYNSAIVAGAGGGWANGTPQFGGTFTAGIPNIVSINKSATTLTGGTNGTTSSAADVGVIVANSTNVLYIGAGYAGATLTYNNSNIGEAFTYNRSLNTNETQTLNSYLALKYGQTLTHNYFHPEYDGTNAATTTLYDVSTYSNRVFGVGKDVVGCFEQKQSISALGSVVAMTIDAALASENTANAGTFVRDRSYLVTGDNNGTLATFSDTWTVSNELPAIYPDETCDPKRLEREWKITATGNDMGVNLVLFDSTHPTAAVKLPAITSDYQLMMLVNDTSDFATDGNQQEIELTFDSGTKTWTGSIFVESGATKYYTFVIKRKQCAEPCVPTNRNIRVRIVK